MMQSVIQFFSVASQIRRPGFLGRIFQTINVAALPALLVAVVQTLAPSSASADDRANRTKLFSGAAVERADERFVLQHNDSHSADVFSGFGHNIDSIEDVLLTHNFVESYRGNLNSYELNYSINRGIVADKDLDSDNNSITEHLIIHEGLVQLTDLIENSPVERMIKAVGRQLKLVRNYTTVHVAENTHGSYKWRRGTAKEQPLMQLKLDANINRGIGPKIEIKDFMQLRMDPIRQRALLELFFNF